MKPIHFPKWLRKLLRRRMLVAFLIIVQAAFFIYLVVSGSMLSQRLSRAVMQIREDFLNTLSKCQQIEEKDCAKYLISKLFQEVLRLFAPLM